MADFQVEDCPFCGVQISVLRNPDTGSVITYAHPQDKQRCFIDAICKTSIHPNLIRKWNTRASGKPVQRQIFYTVAEDNFPVFNETGEGAPCTPQMLNQFFDYMKGKLSGQE